MGTLLRLPSPPILITSQRSNSSFTLLHPNTKTLPRKFHHRIHCGKHGNFLDLKPISKPESLDFDLSWVDPSTRSRFDVIIIGTGPAGLCLAEQVACHGIKDLKIVLTRLGLWLVSISMITGQSIWTGPTVSRKELKMKLLEGCVSNNVKFHQAKVWKAEHKEFESSVVCSDGNELKASLIVDASGFASTFIEYDKPRNHGYQIAHGILAEVDCHPFDLDKMLLMDWRDSHLGNEPDIRARNSTLPTFLYAMPFDSNLVFLEETSLVSRPVLSYMEVKKRMVARLRHLGIKVKSVIEEEKCLIPMGGPLPRIPQSVMGIGGTAGIVHPSTGYMVARTLALAPVLADVIAECLGSTRMIRGKPLCHRVWNGLWPFEKRCVREYYSFGMETLLKLDLNGTRRFFDAFFDLDPHYWHGFLSSRLSLGELAMLSLSLFGRASNPSRFDIVTKCPAPLVKMMGNLALETI
ncbi:hypothetical protein TEA_007752 [Camellia sinensis var. sinensis]|uniref:Lycopene beta-cyclase n=1 Tax=Camellia sinensis var. sinensis TaxID=542762 RepID=A0A4S4DX09_CAMSN|nr:hypothetical protein TEA_007752 [Camellia sinensis var. sinensis]